MSLVTAKTAFVDALKVSLATEAAATDIADALEDWLNEALLTVQVPADTFVTAVSGGGVSSVTKNTLMDLTGEKPNGGLT